MNEVIVFMAATKTIKPKADLSQIFQMSGDSLCFKKPKRMINTDKEKIEERKTKKLQTKIENPNIGSP